MLMRHDLKAEWVQGKGIVVKDKYGKTVEVRYGATQDNFTAYAYISSLGFIGGWTCGAGPHPTRKKSPEFKRLVDSINVGIVYRDMNQLPNSYGRMTADQKRANEERRVLMCIR